VLTKSTGTIEISLSDM